MRAIIPSLILLSCSMAQAIEFQNHWCPALPNVSLKISTGLSNEINAHRDDLPKPQVKLHSEGTLPHQGIYDQSIEAKKDFSRMRNLALYLELRPEDTAAADQLEKLMRAWANIYQISFNPIDETDFDAFIDAYAISRHFFGMDTQSILDNFFRTMATGYITQIRANSTKGTWINNWQSHRIKLITLAGVLLEDPALYSEAKRLFRLQLEQNIREDGSVLDFYERDALHYVTYDLEPLLRAAIAARTRGEDWLHLPNSRGATLGRALDWLVPFARGDLPHQEFIHTNVKFDLIRRGAGISGFTGAWDAKSAKQLYWLATLLDPKYAALAASLGAPPVWQSTCWMS